jgi:hypothetical protein
MWKRIVLRLELEIQEYVECNIDDSYFYENIESDTKNITSS